MARELRMDQYAIGLDSQTQSAATRADAGTKPDSRTGAST